MCAVRAVLGGGAVAVNFEKEKYINLVCSSSLKHANEMLLDDPRQADQRAQNYSIITPSLDPAAQALSSLSLDACVNQSSTVRFLAPTIALEHLTGSTDDESLGQARSERNASTRGLGNHMHNHSRFQNDIDDVTGSLSLKHYSRKSLTHNIPGAFAPGMITKSLP